MKKLLKQTFKLTFILLMLFLSSCEKDLYDEMIKEKKRPDVKVSMKEVKNTPEIVSKLRKNFPSKLKTSSSARGADFLLTLQGDFGNVKLDNVLEVVKLNEKAFTFEIDETVKEPNVYLNLVIDAKDNIWLYKIDRIVQRYKDYPVNSERLVRFRLNNDLTHQPSTPCDTIIYPPFQPDPIDPTTGGGGIIFNGQWQGDYQPQGGFFPPVIISTPGGSTEGTSGSSSGSSGGGGDGETSVFQVIGEAIVDAWQWLVELFSGDPKPESSGCQCNRYSNVVILDVPSNPCDEGGTIAIIPQSPTLDKIYQLNDLLGNQLGYENKMYFYNTGLYLDYFLNLAQNPPANVNYDYNLVIKDLITSVRLTGDFEFVNEVYELAINEVDQSDVNSLVGLTTIIDSNPSVMFEDSFALSLDPYLDLDLNALSQPPSTFKPNLILLTTYQKYRLLRQMNPTWTRSKCLWEATKEIIHISLDAFGLIPVIGEVADLTNGVLYTIEGQGLNATLSYASAVPFIGWASTSTKYGIKLTTTLSGTTKLVWKVTNGVVQFGNRSQLRKVLNLATGNPLVAHHIIPWAKSVHPAVQKAAKSSNAFHMNEALNGIPLSSAVHNGSHANYDSLVQMRLDAIPANATPEQAYDEVMDLINDIRNAINNNPTTPVNQLIF